jgi:hypothetical protein
MINKQDIHAGDHSTNVQGKEVTVNQYTGLSYSDAREIALDVFRSNFYQLSGEAETIARHRVEEFTEELLKRLQTKHDSLLNSMKDPDMQYALYTAQKEYARKGDKNLSNILVDILVDRAAINERSLMQIVLNESLETVPKLTINQLDILTLVFLLRYTRRLHFSDIEDFKKYLIETVVPFSDVPTESSNYQHLEYTGCGAISVLESKIESTFKKVYGGLFSKGFTVEEFSQLTNGANLSKDILIRCFHNDMLKQVCSLNDEHLEKVCIEAGAGNKLVETIKTFQNSKVMEENEIKQFVTSLDPSIKRIFDIWEKTPLNRITLTSVGITIAHANLRKKTNIEHDLSIWI